jgi:hypothetical protein
MKEGTLVEQAEGCSWCLGWVYILISVVIYGSSQTSHSSSTPAVLGEKSSPSSFTPADSESYAPFPTPDFWDNPFSENTTKDVSFSVGDTASKQQPFITFSLFFMGNLKTGYGSSESQRFILVGFFPFCI